MPRPPHDVGSRQRGGDGRRQAGDPHLSAPADLGSSEARDALVLREAGPDDAAAVRDLTRRAYAKWVPALGREPLPMITDQARAISEDQVVLALAGGVPVALVHLVERPDDLLVENLAVDPARQRQGLGDRLLAHAERVAARRGKAHVRLYTNTIMTGNTAFYEARGYVREWEEPFGNGIRVHLAKGMSSERVP